MIRGALILAFTFVYLVVASAIGVPHYFITRRYGLMYAEARFGIRWLLRIAGISVFVRGEQHLSPARTGREGDSAAHASIFMCNHQSNLDPPIAMMALPGELSVLVKKELFSIPVLGLVMRVGRLVPVDREDRDSSHRAVDQAAEMARDGRPFLIFPEGTRSRDGRLLPFKKGPFILAEKAGAPIVPVSISGTRMLMEKGKLRLHPGVVNIIIHPPVFPRDYPDREALSDEVRRRIASGLSEGGVLSNDQASEESREARTRQK
jgi:1-acyl-sn-glycerol-3-phosphate acyltransferase